MAPVPDPAVWNPVAPIQNNWNKIEPWQKGYMAVLGGLGTIFAFANTLALIAGHKGRLPKWPFTAERWNPKPTVDKDQDEKKDEVTEEQILDEELTGVGGALNKRNLNDEHELRWFNEDLFQESFAHSVKQTVLEGVEAGFIDNVKNETPDVIKDGKTCIGKLREEVKEIWHTVEEEGKELLEDVEGVMTWGKQGNKTENGAHSTEHSKTKSSVAKNHRRTVVNFI